MQREIEETRYNCLTETRLADKWTADIKINLQMYNFLWGVSVFFPSNLTDHICDRDLYAQVIATTWRENERANSKLCRKDRKRERICSLKQARSEHWYGSSVRTRSNSNSATWERMFDAFVIGERVRVLDESSRASVKQGIRQNETSDRCLFIDANTLTFDWRHSFSIFLSLFHWNARKRNRISIHLWLTSVRAFDRCCYCVNRI